MNIRGIGCRNVEGIRPAQDTDQELGFCERENELTYSSKAVIFF
jgi:hypothetical protein